MKPLLVSALMIGALSLSALSVSAQDAREAEILGLHQLCDHGDKRACVRFGMMIQQNHDHMEAWRHSHPDWFWWEH